MATGHQSPQSTLPPFALKQVNTTTWGAGGNSVTITDEYVHPNSMVFVQVSGSTPPAGFWAVSISQGSFTITSSDAESSTLAIAYIVL